jgi:hypothetical protein
MPAGSGTAHEKQVADGTFGFESELGKAGRGLGVASGEYHDALRSSVPTPRITCRSSSPIPLREKVRRAKACQAIADT